MRPWLAALSVVVLLGPVLAAADNLSVDFDPRADFSAFRTFAMRDAKVSSPRPELDNRLFVKMLSTRIRTSLAARGLREVMDGPDLLVDFTVTGEDFSIGVPSGVRGAGPVPQRSTQGTLVIDLVKPGGAAPVWHGVYREEEDTGSALVQKLPEDARKLVAKYPPKGE